MDHSSKWTQFIFGDYCQLPPVGGSICDSIINDHDFASTDTFLLPPWQNILAATSKVGSSRLLFECLCSNVPITNQYVPINSIDDLWFNHMINHDFASTDTFLVPAVAKCPGSNVKRWFLPSLMWMFMFQRSITNQYVPINSTDDSIEKEWIRTRLIPILTMKIIQILLTFYFILWH